MEYKNNMMSYLVWRGDLGVSLDPFNEVDSLILSQLVYCKFEGIVPGIGQKGSITIADAAEEYRKRHLKEGDESERKKYEVLLMELAHTPRFAKMELLNYVSDTTNLDQQAKQFAAMHVRVSKKMTYVVFRGTDNTIIGWRENFDMCYQLPVPGQKAAADYLNQTVKKPFHKYWVGGHSKGGNLAVYSSVFCDEKVQRKIVRVDSFDGPGFNRKLNDEPGHKRIEDRIRSFVPQSSVIGMLMEHQEKYYIVESQENGLYQHSMTSWYVSGTKLIRLTERDKQSIRTENALQALVKNMTEEEIKSGVENFFQVLEEAGICVVEDFLNLNMKSMMNIIKAVGGLSSENRELIIRFMKLLLEETQNVNKEKTRT